MILNDFLLEILPWINNKELSLFPKNHAVSESTVAQVSYYSEVLSEYAKSGKKWNLELMITDSPKIVPLVKWRFINFPLPGIKLVQFNLSRWSTQINVANSIWICIVCLMKITTILMKVVGTFCNIDNSDSLLWIH